MIRSQSFPVAIFLNRKMDSRLIRHHEQELSITHKRKGAFQTADPSRYEKSSTTKGPSERKKERQEMRSLFFFFFFQHKNNSYSFPSWLLPPYNLRARGRRWRAKQKATTRRRKQHSTFFLSWRANISFLFFPMQYIMYLLLFRDPSVSSFIFLFFPPLFQYNLISFYRSRVLTLFFFLWETARHPTLKTSWCRWSAAHWQFQNWSSISGRMRNGPKK